MLLMLTSVLNMNYPEPKKISKFAIGFSISLAIAIITYLVFGFIKARWNILGLATVLILACSVWIIWVIHLSWILLRRNIKSGKRWTWFGIWVASFLGIGCLSLQIPDLAINYEVRLSIDAGLKEDCMRLLSEWPENKFVLTPSDIQFPNSIKILSPLMLYNDFQNNASLANIGICKDGFGGFRCGIRVFRNDEDADLYRSEHDCVLRRIEVGIYYFWNNED